MTKEEIKEWMDNPTTKYILAKLKIFRTEHLEGVTQMCVNRNERSAHIDEVRGMDKMLDIIQNIGGDEE